MAAPKTDAERFWPNVSKLPDGGCWIWLAYRDRDGYGRFHFQGSTVAAHRWAYQSTGREIPEGLELDHLCRTRSCVNPEHLEPVEHRENLMRGETCAAAAVQKTHCKRGHPLAGENLRPHTKTRQCRICNSMHTRARSERLKAERAAKRAGRSA